MTASIPPCRKVIVYAFRGDRTPAFYRSFLKRLDQERMGVGPGPSLLDCLMFAGHAGLSIDAGNTIFGFNPDGSQTPVWKLMDDLQNGLSFPGVVRDDRAVFQHARQRHGMAIHQYGIVLPDPGFQAFARVVDAEHQHTRFRYGFPNGDGDCNCITWMERMALPLLTGAMREFFNLPGFQTNPTRRFGICV